MTWRRQSSTPLHQELSHGCHTQVPDCLHKDMPPRLANRWVCPPCHSQCTEHNGTHGQPTGLRSTDRSSCGDNNRALKAPEDSVEELDNSNTQDCSPAHNSTSSLHEVVTHSLPAVTDDSKQFQNLFKWMAQSQNIPLKELTENQHQLLKILHAASSTKIMLPINNALMEPAESVWQTPAIIPPRCKRAEKKYYVPNKGMDFLFSHPQPNSLVVDVVNQQGKQPKYKSTSRDQDYDWICLVAKSISL